MHKPGSLEKYNNKVSFATYMPTIINVKLVSIYIWEVGVMVVVLNLWLYGFSTTPTPNIAGL